MGRAGRQGDPGESRFFVSLEDQLWKVFNSKMLENPILRGWPTMEEVRDKFITGMILKTQERIENHYFEARKHVLGYDDVLNTQRETIYGKRGAILLGTDVGGEIQNGIHEFTGEAVDRFWTVNEEGLPEYDYEGLYEDLNEFFPLVDHASLSQLMEIPAGEELRQFCLPSSQQIERGAFFFCGSFALMARAKSPEEEGSWVISSSCLDHLNLLALGWTRDIFVEKRALVKDRHGLHLSSWLEMPEEADRGGPTHQHKSERAGIEAPFDLRELSNLAAFCLIKLVALAGS